MRNWLWAVEERWPSGAWLSWRDSLASTREQARELQRQFKLEGLGESRIRKYVRVESSK